MATNQASASQFSALFVNPLKLRLNLSVFWSAMANSDKMHRVLVSYGEQ